MESTLRWAILGPGAMSRAFAADLRHVRGAGLVAVGSRSGERAAAFADEFGCRRAYGSYDELVSDPEVDAVYVGTPHTLHEEHAVLCLEHGKHVLCEKPLAINAVQARHMIDAARASDRLLMEAMWTRFLPAMERVRRVIADGAIGEPRVFTADFGFRAEFDPSSRLFDPALGGGALLDLGVYVVSLATMIFGPAVDVDGHASLGATGVDEECSFITRHTGGQLAHGVASFRKETARTASIQGTRGSVLIHSPWWGASRITVVPHDGGEDRLHLPFRGAGFVHEAEAFMRLIADGRRESPVMPLAESLAVMDNMDRLRRGWGVTYPMERAG